MSTKQLYNASRRFPADMIQRKQGNDYVDHAVITQRIMQVFGWFDQEIVREIRGHVPAWKPGTDDEKPALDNAVTGVVLRITVHTDTDGPRSITEIGEVEFPHNHTTDASRAKHATSDAIKRCAMRLGIGLHLWAQGLYTLDSSLYAQLHEDDEEVDDDGVPEPPDPSNLPVDPDAPDELEPGDKGAQASDPDPEPEQPKSVSNPDGKPTNKQKQKARIQIGELGIIHIDEETGEVDETIYRAAMQEIYGDGVNSIAKLTKGQISKLIDSLDKGSKGRTPGEVAEAIIAKGRKWLEDTGQDVPDWAKEV